MTRMGEGHPPPSATKARSGWHNSFVAVATLLREKSWSYMSGGFGAIRSGPLENRWWGTWDDSNGKNLKRNPV